MANYTKRTGNIFVFADIPANGTATLELDVPVEMMHFTRSNVMMTDPSYTYGAVMQPSTVYTFPSKNGHPSNFYVKNTSGSTISQPTIVVDKLGVSASSAYFN